ncbi:EamA family transporter RarD [Paenibacillus xerothermodurans]|uniref:EamA family transporter RarD n=1 Tax=Paenibacillus xerothermodurans TaxID=1977292 RepID=A0A2W1NRI4_PAEXE|nr:EamA family transporter RarD [Paenibacillus xerothermodurans]PZE20356.1 EamA family transporter RarD [Paenibacillus xerothermodurans]
MNQGIIYGLLAYLAWGLLPLYWRLFQTMPAWEILAHRMVWSFVFVALLVTVARRWRQLIGVISSGKSKLAVCLCAFFISINWFLFIWAVNNGHVIETSLGYYMNPLISVFFAVIFLKERLRLGQWAAIILAAAGVVIMAVQYGHIPWVAIALAVSFAFYGLAKKMANLDTLLGLTWETLVVVPISLCYLLYLQTQGTAAVLQLSGFSLVLLLLSGAATALPLFWFAQAAKLLPLSMVGFIQYIAPTTSLLLAIFVFHEPFTEGQLISFSFIWFALIVYSIATFTKTKSQKSLKKAA